MTRNSKSQIPNPQSTSLPVSCILQRAAVRTISEKIVQPIEETKTLDESHFLHDFSAVPAYTAAASIIQPKLKIGVVGDKYEQEADQLARQMVSQINAPEGETVQREEMPEEEDEKLQMKPMLQRQVAGDAMAATPELETSIQKARGSGQPLARNIRKPMENAFGADFSSVKVHTDAQSDQLNQLMQAKAFTTKQNIFFRQGEYNPESQSGKELIAHELTHVLQQGSAVVRREQANDEITSLAGKNSQTASMAISAQHHENKIQRTVHERYERQWDYAIEQEILTPGEVKLLRQKVEPLKGKEDQEILEVVSLSNKLTKKFKDKDAKRKRQALIWLKLYPNLDIIAAKREKEKLTNIADDKIQLSRQLPAHLPESQLEFLSNPKRVDGFLKYVAKLPEDIKTPKVTQKTIDVYKASVKFNDGTKFNRKDAINYVESILKPALDDPAVDHLIKGYAQQLSLQTLRDTLQNEETFEKQGKKAISNVAGKFHFHIVSAYGAYNNWLKATPEGRKEARELSQQVKIDKFSNTSPRQQANFEELKKKIAAKSDNFRKQAKIKLRDADVKEGDLDSTLDNLIKYIREAPTTINFGGQSQLSLKERQDATRDKIELYEGMPGYTTLWAAPQETFDQGYIGKRNQVEKEVFGFDDDPYSSAQEADRPRYAAANLGSVAKGASPYYGTSYLVLNESVKDRATYSQKDTFSGITNLGTKDYLEGIIAEMTPDKIKQILAMMSKEKGSRELAQNEHIELHIHGPVDWQKDVAKIVIDQSVVEKDSALDERIRKFASQNKIIVEYYNSRNWNDIASQDLKEAHRLHSPKPLQKTEMTVSGSDKSAPKTKVPVTLNPEKKAMFLTELNEKLAKKHPY